MQDSVSSHVSFRRRYVVDDDRNDFLGIFEDLRLKVFHLQCSRIKFKCVLTDSYLYRMSMCSCCRLSNCNIVLFVCINNNPVNPSNLVHSEQKSHLLDDRGAPNCSRARRKAHWRMHNVLNGRAERNRKIGAESTEFSSNELFF